MDTMSRSPMERNVAAELRAVEEGHRALLCSEAVATGTRRWIRVVSDTHPGKEYHVTASASVPGDPVAFRCEPAGPKAFTDDHQVAKGSAGVVGCKHAAVAARRLERERLIVLDTDSGLWLATKRIAPFKRAEPRPAPEADDPFAGLPS